MDIEFFVSEKNKCVSFSQNEHDPNKVFDLKSTEVVMILVMVRAIIGMYVSTT